MIIRRCISFLKYYWQAVNHYRLHSPVLFDFYKNVLVDTRQYYGIESIEQFLKYKSTELFSNKILSIDKFPSQNRMFNLIESGKFLFKLTLWYKPEIAVVMNADYCISSVFIGKTDSKLPILSYFNNGNVNDPFDIFENIKVWNNTNYSEARIDALLLDIENLCPKKLLVVVHLSEFVNKFGSLLSVLEPILSSSEALIVVDGINSTKESQELWKVLSNHTYFQYAIDLHNCGLLLNTLAEGHAQLVRVIPFKYKPIFW